MDDAWYIHVTVFECFIAVLVEVLGDFGFVFFGYVEREGSDS